MQGGVELLVRSAARERAQQSLMRGMRLEPPEIGGECICMLATESETIARSESRRFASLRPTPRYAAAAGAWRGRSGGGGCGVSVRRQQEVEVEGGGGAGGGEGRGVSVRRERHSNGGQQRDWVWSGFRT